MYPPPCLDKMQLILKKNTSNHKLKTKILAKTLITNWTLHKSFHLDPTYSEFGPCTVDLYYKIFFRMNSHYSIIFIFFIYLDQFIHSHDDLLMIHLVWCIMGFANRIFRFFFFFSGSPLFFFLALDSFVCICINFI